MYARASVWSGVFATPLLEEIGFRLFLMGGMAWLLSRSIDDRRTVFRVALGVSALVFGPLHLMRPPAGLLDATVVVLKAGAAGLVLGWVFWRWGLPYSIACHGATNGIHLMVCPRSSESVAPRSGRPADSALQPAAAGEIMTRPRLSGRTLPDGIGLGGRLSMELLATRSLVACAILAVAACGGRQESKVLPGGVRLMLDQQYSGWRIASVSTEVRDWGGERLGPTPNVIVGDFDGNGRADYALLIEYPNTDAPEKAYTHYSEALAFLDDAGSFRLVRLRERQPGPNSELFVTLQRRGAEGFDFEANRRFTYPHDSIGEWYFSKAGGTYIFSDGRFRYVHEAD